jgi:hypothetical protein
VRRTYDSARESRLRSVAAFCAASGMSRLVELVVVSSRVPAHKHDSLYEMSSGPGKRAEPSDRRSRSSFARLWRVDSRSTPPPGD